MRRLLLIELMVLSIFVLLGNGLRSVGLATISVSQGEFASFLNISVHRTEILTEALLAGAIIALLIAPFILTRRSAVKIARNAAGLAAISYGLVGITMIVNPGLLTREVIVIACFVMAGFAVAFFAPLSQLVIADVEDQKKRTGLMTLWIAAQPLAFLVTPQLVKYVAFDVGTGNFFLILAAMPLLFLAVLPLALLHINKKEPPSEPERAIPWLRLSAVIGLIFIFEALTASITLVGILSSISVALLVILMIACAAAYRARAWLFSQHQPFPTRALWLIAILLVIQIPSTGIFDAAYLVRHLCSVAFMADRATTAGLFQIAAVFGTGALLIRWPVQKLLLALGLLCVLISTVMIAGYPTRPYDDLLFNSSKWLMSLGMGVSTAVLIREILEVSNGNRVVIMAPAFTIIIGTELGIEILEIVFEVTELMGADDDGSYFAVFVAQIVSMLVALTIMVAYFTRRQSPDHSSPVNKLSEYARP